MRGATVACRGGVALGLWLLASIGLSAEPLPWIADHQEAVEKARQQGRLLFVVHLSGDFTDNSPKSRQAIVYASLGLTDEGVREFLASRCILTYRHVGRPAVFVPEEKPRGKSKSAVPAPPEDEFAVAYLCLADERVLHFVPGFVSDKDLLAELTFAEACYLDLVRFPREEQPAAVRQLHLEAVSPATLEQFRKLCSTRWDRETPRPASPDDFENAVRAARQLRDQRLAKRLGMNWSAAEFEVVAKALAGHGSLEKETPHLVLAEHPLPKLGDIERAVYTIWSGKRFWKAGRRQEEIRDWIASRGARGKPLLLAADADPQAPGAKTTKDPLAWPIRSAQLAPLLEEFDVLTLSLDELAAWLAEKGLGPIKHPAGHNVRYVVFGRRGELIAAVSQRDGVGRLVSAMNAASRTGETAVAKERRDE